MQRLDVMQDNIEKIQRDIDLIEEWIKDMSHEIVNLSDDSTIENIFKSHKLNERYEILHQLRVKKLWKLHELKIGIQSRG